MSAFLAHEMGTLLSTGPVDHTASLPFTSYQAMIKGKQALRKGLLSVTAVGIGHCSDV